MSLERHFVDGARNARGSADIPTRIVDYTLPNDIPTMWLVRFIVMPRLLPIPADVSVDESGFWMSWMQFVCVFGLMTV